MVGDEPRSCPGRGSGGGPALAGTDGYLLDELTAGPAADRALPTFAEYVPVVAAAVSPGTARAYGSYGWRNESFSAGHRTAHATEDAVTACRGGQARESGEHGHGRCSRPPWELAGQPRPLRQAECGVLTLARRLRDGACGEIAV